MPLMRLTQKWTRHFMAQHWHDMMGWLGFFFCFFSGFLSPAGWAQTGFSLLAHRNFYCKLLHIITFYSSRVSWWARRPDSESPNGLAHGVLLMHVIRSYMSQWALNHEATSRFSVVVNNDANESIKCGLWGLRKESHALCTIQSA